MPFKFVYFCDLFSSLESLSIQDPPLLPASLRDHYQRTITQWFRSHRARIDGLDPSASVALLSALFPERRTDRVYNLQPPSLTKVLGRCLGLGVSRRKELERWKEPGRGDLGACVERVQREAEMPRVVEGREVTIEEVDQALVTVAGKSRFSGPKVRGQAQPMGQFQDSLPATMLHEVLGGIYLRLQSRQAKWFTRMILKDYSPVVLPEGLVLRSFHFLLPDFLRAQDSFEAALGMLKSPVVGGWPAMPKQDEMKRYCGKAAQFLVPKVGVKVGRITYLKARSIKHALQMAGRRRMSLERKHDGEYCQVHIDLTKGEHCVRIFSKSGKDSTLDKKGVHGAIKKALRIDTANCAICRHCILEGELVVWSDQEQKILEFHKMRKHLSRSGVYLGTSRDSQAHDYEHLMIVFYDLLLMDDEPILTKPHRERRRRLENLVTIIPGRAEVVTREEIYFSSPGGSRRLQKALAHAFTQRWEGYVLKPSDQPYFDFGQQPTGSYGSCWIKLKKDYIQGFGDTADFAVVGGGYHAAEAIRLGLKNVAWTHFHIGCLQNKEDVVRFQAKPKFIVVDAFNQSIKAHDMDALNQLGKFRALKLGSIEAKEAFNVKIEPGLSCKMDVVFKDPFVFEVMGSGFDKPANRDYFVLRFPRILKIHWDRGLEDSISFEELQEMADQARKAPVEHSSQEDAAWIERLEQANRGTSGTVVGWEASQDLNEDSLDLPLIRSSQTPARSVQKVTAVPMVRMDSQEMLPTERRLVTGEVSSRPTSHQSLTKLATKVSSLATPPPSSPQKPREDYIKQPPGHSSNIGPLNLRKRAFTVSELEDGSYPTKRNRASLPAGRSKPSSSNAPKCTSTSRPALDDKPLVEVTNSSRRPWPVSKIGPVEQSNRVSTPALPLVSKLAVGTEIRSSMTKKTKRVIAASSSFHETIAPEHSDTMPPSSATSSLQPMQEDRPEAIQAVVPSAPSHPRTVRLPLLSECQVLLSPCVAGMAYLTEDLLPLHSAAHALISDFIAPNPRISESLPVTPPTSGDEVVVLVESERAHATAGVVQSLVPVVKQEKKRFVIWDWRLLERLRTEKGRGEALKKCYVGRMDWDEGLGVVIIRWLRGKATEVKDS